MPGSVLQIRVDATNPLAWGLDDDVDVMFSANPVFRLPEDEDEQRPQARGLVRRQDAAAQRLGLGPGASRRRRGHRQPPVGKGRLVLFGPQILFRGQPHGTFKFLFNAIVGAGGEMTKATDTGAR